MKRAMLIIATLTSVVWFTPLAADAGTGCRGADAHEHGSSDIIDATVAYQDNAIEPSTVALDPRMTVKVQLAAASCDGISYSVDITDPTNGNLLGTATLNGNGSERVVLMDATKIVAPSAGESVNVVIRTSSARSAEIDRAPNSGSNTVTDDVPPGQGWN